MPGSIIAKLWFDTIFPPVNGSALDGVFSNLMVISTSLSLGLIVGFVTVQIAGSIFWSCLCCGRPMKEKEVVLGRLAGMYSVPVSHDDDPSERLKHPLAYEVNRPSVQDEETENVTKDVPSYFPVKTLENDELEDKIIVNKDDEEHNLHLNVEKNQSDYVTAAVKPVDLNDP